MQTSNPIRPFEVLLAFHRPPKPTHGLPINWLEAEEVIMFGATHLPALRGGLLALLAAVPGCKVQVDMSKRLVTVQSAEDRLTLAEALTEAGYPPS